MTITVDAAGATDLRLTQIGEHEWLIHDARYPREDPRCLVAFVNDQAGDVDVIWLGAHAPVGPFASVDAVLQAALA
jgi:hypothetical protein